MKHALWIAAIAVTVFAMSLSAVAQPGGGQGGQRGQGAGAGQGQQQFGQGQLGGAQQATPQALLRNAQVVTQLGITAEQTTAINALFPQQGRGVGAVGGGVAPQQPPAQLTAAERQARTAEQFAGIAGILNAEQLKKFNDIYFQMNVPVVNPNAPANAPAPIMNLNAYLLAAVDLTAAQKEAIAKIAADRDAANAPVAGQQPGGGQQLTQEERQARMTAQRERNTKANDDIMALLTAAQKAEVAELTAGAPAVRRNLLGAGQQRPQGQQGAQPGAGGGQRGQGGGAGGGFAPGENSWQPGQGAPGGGAGGGRRAGGAGGGGN